MLGLLQSSIAWKKKFQWNIKMKFLWVRLFKVSTILFVYNLMIECLSKNRGNYPREVFEQNYKEIRIKI